MRHKLSLPKMGLYARFFLLFNVTTVLLAIFITLGFFTYSEGEVRELIRENHDQIYERLTRLHDKDINIEKIREEVSQPKVDIKVVRGEQVWTTWDNFPEVSTLLESAEPIKSLYFTKYQFRYYLLANKEDTWVAFTALPATLLLSPGWLKYWPWVAAVLVFTLSYLALRRWLKPIAEATKSSKRVSQGEFNYRIDKHPKTELAELTRGLNKMAADLQQLFDAKNELLLAISHELRTPMARMKVSLAMLEESSVSADLNKDIAQMDQMIEQLLEAERLEQGHKVLHQSHYYLPSLMEEILAEQDNAESISVASEIPEEAIQLDIGRIKFLLRNLLRNAIEYSPKEAKVELVVDQTDKEFVFSVRDNGPGISTELQERIFEPFYRVENIDNRSHKGVGLGLYLCRKIAIAHGGSLTVESVVGKGSCFRFVLPKT
ncbi:MAG: HAMP domain-containing protein [Alteromonadaceae bacterium]|nr:HAMP domain-containing protein [Alteromonadaceae bacterium]